MFINKKVYEDLLKSCSSIFAESGGLLGGKNNIITCFKFDKGVGEKSIGEYYPNVNELNNQINLWRKRNICFYGLAHSHFQAETSLSRGDIIYIKRIMLNMQKEIKFLYFPIVFPLEHKIMSFKAIYDNENIVIAEDKIKII